MTTTYKIGTGTGGGAYVRYLLSKAQELGHALDATARYYAGREAAPEVDLSPLDELGRALHAGEIDYDQALSDLVRAEMASLPDAELERLDIDGLEERASRNLDAAVTRADYAEAGLSITAGSAILRPDLDPALARRLEIDTTRPLTVIELAHLMDNRTALGNEIEGKKKHSAHRSVAETFALDEKAFPSVEAVRNVLAGKRADGSEPVTEKGKAIPEKSVESSLRKFKVAIGVPNHRDATAEEIQRVADGRINGHDYRKHIGATAPPVGYVDFVNSADKSVSSSWALAPTDAEAAIIRTIVHDANADVMRYLEGRIGIARSGAQGNGPTEAGKLAWFSTEHFDARPTVDVIRYDAQGRPFSAPLDVPGKVDPNLHVHNPVFSSMLTPSGRIASLNIDLLDGEIKVCGAVFHAAIATHAREYGINVALGPHGEARFTDVSEGLRQFHSRRTIEGADAAKEYAKEQGKDWDKLKPREQIALMDAAVAWTRRDKGTPEAGVDPADRSVHQTEAEAAGFRHRSVLRPDAEKPAELTQEQRTEIAREAALPLLDKEFQSRSVIEVGKVREIAARGLIISGLSNNPEADIEAVYRTFRERGIMVNGENTNIIEADALDKDGRKKTWVTSGKAVELEEGLIVAVRLAASDRSTALSSTQIDRAAEAFLVSRPYIDRDGAQWQSQRAMMHAIGEGGRVSLSVGVAGSGKTSSVVSALVDAWHTDGRTVYGMTVPWKPADALRNAGVDHALAIAAFLNRVEKGKIKVDEKTVIVADEVSQIGVPHQIALMKLVSKTGAQLVEIGDPRQCGSVETPAIDLMAKAIGDENIPKLLTTIRQKSEHDRAVATMFRDGQAADGIAELQKDGRFHLVAGGREATIKQTTALWRSLTEANRADPNYSLIVMTATNEQARTVGMAIRENRQAAGEISRAGTTLKARDPNSGESFDLPVAAGDKLRMFTRTHDADTRGQRKYLSANGDVLEVLEVLSDGLRVRNAKEGEVIEGRITWAQMKPWRAPKNDPVMATYGYAVTIDTAQSRTETASITAFVDGTAQVMGTKGYTALSRHTHEAHIVASDAAERRAIVGRQMLGTHETPSQEDVVRNIANNLSRFARRENATDLIERAVDVQRGMVRNFLRGSEAVERNARHQGPADMTQYEMSRISESAPAAVRSAAEHASEHVRDRVRDMSERARKRLPSQQADTIWQTQVEERARTQRPQRTQQQDHDRGYER